MSSAHSEVKKAEDRLNTLVAVLGAQRNEAHNVVAQLKTDLLIKEKECKDLTVRLEETQQERTAEQAKYHDNVKNLMARIEALMLDLDGLRAENNAIKSKVKSRKNPQT